MPGEQNWLTAALCGTKQAQHRYVGTQHMAATWQQVSAQCALCSAACVLHHSMELCHLWWCLVLRCISFDLPCFCSGINSRDVLHAKALWCLLQSMSLPGDVVAVVGSCLLIPCQYCFGWLAGWLYCVLCTASWSDAACGTAPCVVQQNGPVACMRAASDQQHCFLGAGFAPSSMCTCTLSVT